MVEKQEMIIKEVTIPKEEYLSFDVSTSKPLDAYKIFYDVFAKMFQVKRSRIYVRDLRYDATDNSFFIRIEISDKIDETEFLTTRFTIEGILSGAIPKEGEKTNLNIKLRIRLTCEIKVKGEGFWYDLNKFMTYVYYKLFYEKVFEDRVKRMEEALEKAESEFIRILS